MDFNFCHRLSIRLFNLERKNEIDHNLLDSVIQDVESFLFQTSESSLMYLAIKQKGY